MATTYSHSRLWLFESCPEFYKLKYIDKKLPPLPLSVNLFLGSQVHETLEWLYKKTKENQMPTLHELIWNYATSWKTNFPINLRFKKGETEEEYLNKGVKFLIDYYQKHKPFNDNTISIEKRILFQLDEQGDYFIQGYIDRLVLNENGEYEVHDYKTNAFMKTQEELDKDKQLAFYHIGLQELFGKDVDVKLVWHFLAHNKNISSKRTQEQLNQLKQETIALIKKIESTTYWPSCGKPWCDWCNYKKENNIN